MLKRLRQFIKQRREANLTRRVIREEIAALEQRIQIRVREGIEGPAILSGEDRLSRINTMQDSIRGFSQHLAFLKQLEIRARLEANDIEIPTQYLVEQSAARVVNLTHDGEKWARNAFRKRRRDNVEFWFKLFLLVLSLIVSIIAIVISVHKK